MTSFLQQLAERAASRNKRIAFAEAADPRVRDAILALHAEQTVRPVVIASPGLELAPFAAAGIEVIDPLADPRSATLTEWLHERRRLRGMTAEAATAAMRDPLCFADAMVATHDVDGCVAGAVYTTADVLRTALWTVGPAEGVSTVSSAFYMVVHPFRSESPEVLTFTDGAVVPEPTVAQLADIGLAAARDRTRIVGDVPRVAFLSFATRGSAGGPLVERVRAAAEEFRRRAPDIAVDGEMQVDAALIAAVGSRKAPDSPVAGRANVLVFPSLDAGNIGYKLVERLAGASAVGPIIQGLRRPCSDLSRGASRDDIKAVAAVTALQA